jgi:hypothetical protein
MAVCIFYVVAYITLYAANYLTIAHYVYLSVLNELLISAVAASVLFLVVYFISKRFFGRWNLGMIGFKKENFVKSLLLASAVLAPIEIFLVVAANLVGVNSLSTSWAISWLSPPYQLWLPFYAIAVWSLYGLISFSILQAFPHSLLKNYKYALIAISVLWIGLYNFPLLTGQLLPDDILFLGILFLVVYHYTKNVLGMVIVYVLAYEGPVLWTIGAAWGSGTLIITLYARTIWCSASAIILAGYSLIKRRTGTL